MSRTSHLSRLAGVALLGASLVVALAPGVAGARHASKGSKSPITCTITGTMTATPGLSLGSGKATVLKLAATLGSCSGNPAAAKITGGTVTGKSVDTSASCVAFENAFPALAGKVKYQTSGGRLGRTVFAFSGGTLNYNATPLSITYPKHGGKGVAKSVFKTKAAKMTLVLSQTYPQWVSTCKGSNGLTTMTLAAGSTITV